MTVANEGVTGTTVNRFVKLTGAPSKAIIATTADVDNVIGVCVSGCGTTGNATIAIIGQVTIDFDGATTAGNYVIVSVTSGGKAHDGGATFPAGSTAYGRVLSTNGAGGAFIMELMTPDLAAAAGTSSNGKNKPGGSTNQLQYNSNGNTLGGAPFFRVDANTIQQSNTTNAQTQTFYKTTDSDSSPTNYERLRTFINATPDFVVTTENGGTGTLRGLTIGTNSNGIRIDTTGNVLPTTDSALTLGSSGKSWLSSDINTQNTNIVSFRGFGRLDTNSVTDGALRVRPSSGTTGGTFLFPANTPAQIVANTNNYDPGSLSYWQRWSSDASRNVTGMTAGNQNGQIILIANIGAQNIVLQHENASSTAGNRFHNSTGVDITLVPDQSAECVYDSTLARWACRPVIGSTTAFVNTTNSGTLNVTGHVTVEGVTSTGATGTGKFVFDTSPTFTTSAISPLFRSTAAKVLFQGTGTGATQLSATQTTAPTCTTNCGTSPSVVGTDSAGIVTMGATGTPASGWVVTFNGTWAAAPACLVTSALAGMLVGKMPIVVATTTTTFTVTTNGTAPANSDKYAFQCMGTQ